MKILSDCETISVVDLDKIETVAELKLKPVGKLDLIASLPDFIFKNDGIRIMKLQIIDYLYRDYG